MLDSITLFHLCAFVALFLSFKNLDALKRSSGESSPASFFPAILGVVAAIQFSHVRGYRTLDDLFWWAFIFLAASPFLGILFFRPLAMRRLLKTIAIVLVWIASFLWIGRSFEWSPEHLFAWSLVPAVILAFPWAWVWKACRQSRNRRQSAKAENLKAQRVQEEVQLKKAQEEEDEALLRDLIRDLGK